MYLCYRPLCCAPSTAPPIVEQRLNIVIREQLLDQDEVVELLS